MEIVDGVLKSISENDILRGVLTIPEGVTEIVSLFEDYQTVANKIDKVIFPTTLKKVGASAFKGCRNLREVVCSDNINEIGEYAFSGCKQLKSVKFPSNPFEINKYAFKDCFAIEGDLDLKNVISISDSAFENCKSIKNVNISSVEMKLLGDSAFKNCSGLKSVNLADKIYRFEEHVFYGCESLKKVELPNNIEKIPTQTFCNCLSLKNITIPDNVRLICRNAFGFCEDLKEIKLSKNLYAISGYAFANCKSLESVELPESLDIINSHAFFACLKLKKVSFPKSVEKIEKNAFLKCISLKEVKLNNANIEDNAFYNCYSLNSFSIDEGELGKQNFEACGILRNVQIGENVKFNNLYLNNLQKLNYMFKKDKKFVFSNEKDNSNSYINLKNINSINGTVLTFLWDKKDKLETELQNKNIIKLYNCLVKELGKDGFVKFWNNKNIKFFKQIENLPEGDDDFNAFCKFYYNLGGFSLPIQEEIINKSGNKIVKEVNYAQIVGEFMKEYFLREENIFDCSKDLFENMKLSDFKPEFTKFFLNKQNFTQFIEESKRDKNLIRNSFENYEKVQKTNTSHKGNQRQLKPTVSKFKDYFINDKFEGVDLANYKLASTIAPYYTTQRSFDNALKIERERIDNGVGEHILGEPLQEEDIFGEINNLSDMIKSKGVGILKILNGIAKRNFTFEWLQKNDPQNFILGKLCTCCSHLEGNGYTIMHASIVHNDIQNLVIKDEQGEIIGKSTLYVNREQGYGIFNNLEINNNIKLKDGDMETIFRKFQLGAVSFIKKYNEKNPDKPLRKVNIGMDNTDAEDIITKELTKEKELLQSFYYYPYADGDNDAIAGSYKRQYIVWQEHE